MKSRLLSLPRIVSRPVQLEGRKMASGVRRKPSCSNGILLFGRPGEIAARPAPIVWKRLLFGGYVDQTAQHLGNLVEFDGLVEEKICAALQAPFTILRIAVLGEDDDRRSESISLQAVQY